MRLVGVDLLLPAAEDVRAPAGRLAAAGHPHALSAFLYSGTKVAPLVPSVSFGS
ncbi:hypothetical protein [Amycolatopsis sp. NPDC021455]|uniref:hypothetical protein n=1 Tax=Amycolatopsis sp. NPDC021455 TaxID=3154901 RepID=UPI0033DA82ED